MIAVVTYIHEAVMEMQAQKRSSNTRFPVNCSL